jgi:hypothetical protein
MEYHIVTVDTLKDPVLVIQKSSHLALDIISRHIHENIAYLVPHLTNYDPHMLTSENRTKCMSIKVTASEPVSCDVARTLGYMTMCYVCSLNKCMHLYPEIRDLYNACIIANPQCPPQPQYYGVYAMVNPHMTTPVMCIAQCGLDKVQPHYITVKLEQHYALFIKYHKRNYAIHPSNAVIKKVIRGLESEWQPSTEIASYEDMRSMKCMTVCFLCSNEYIMCSHLYPEVADPRACAELFTKPHEKTPAKSPVNTKEKTQEKTHPPAQRATPCPAIKVEPPPKVQKEAAPFDDMPALDTLPKVLMNDDHFRFLFNEILEYTDTTNPDTYKTTLPDDFDPLYVKQTLAYIVRSIGNSNICASHGRTLYFYDVPFFESLVSLN